MGEGPAYQCAEGAGSQGELVAEIRLGTDGTLGGWVYDPGDLQRRFVVEILGDGLPVALVRAEMQVPALRDAGFGDGCYGFAVVLDARFPCDGFELRLANDERVLARCRAEAVELAQLETSRCSHVWWRGGLRLSGFLEEAPGSGRPPTLHVYLGSKRLGVSLTFHPPSTDARGLAFDLTLPGALGDGELHHLRVLDGEGLELQGSPVTVLAHPSGFRGLAAEAQPGALAFLDELMPASLPFERAAWARHFDDADGVGAGEGEAALGVLVLGREGCEATMASLEAQRGRFHLRASVLGEGEMGPCFRQSEWASALAAFGSGNVAATLVLQAGTVLKPNACRHVFAALGAGAEPPAVVIGDYEVAAGDGPPVPFFGPAFDYERILAQGYAAGVFALRRLPELEGEADAVLSAYDILLAALEEAKAQGDAVAQLPRILARIPMKRDDATDRLASAVRRHLARIGMPAEVAEADGTLFPLVHVRRPRPDGEVAIVIPTRDRLDLLQPCIASIRSRTAHPENRIVIVDNGSRDAGMLAFLAELAREGATILRDEGAFNYARLNNLALREIRSPFACLLNDDVEVETPDWLVELQCPFSRADVGAVGAKLVWPNGMLQHGGVVLGMNFGAGHAYDRYCADEAGYGDGILAMRACSALTGACLMLRRQDFWDIGGFDEVGFPVAFNDVDLCLRLGEAGKSMLWNPRARLLHRGSASRGSDRMSPDRRARFARELALLRERWGQRLRDDAYYNPNLNLDAHAFTGLAQPPRDCSARVRRVRF